MHSAPFPFLEAASTVDEAGVAFVEGVSTNLDYRMNAGEIATLKARLNKVGLRVPGVPSRRDPGGSPLLARQLLDFAKALEIEIVLTKQPFDTAQGGPFDTAQGRPFDTAQGGPVDLEGIKVAVEDGRGMYQQDQPILGRKPA